MKCVIGFDPLLLQPDAEGSLGVALVCIPSSDWPEL